jgi:ABC-type phosphate/phosphonate transport system permease subunit
VGVSAAWFVALVFRFFFTNTHSSHQSVRGKLRAVLGAVVAFVARPLRPL